MRACSAPGCGAPIDGCFGFVKAGDILEAQEGSRAPERIRELCGRCGLPGLLAETKEELIAFLKKIGWL